MERDSNGSMYTSTIRPGDLYRQCNEHHVLLYNSINDLLAHLLTTNARLSASIDIVINDFCVLSAMKFNWKSVLPLEWGTEWTLPNECN